MQYVKIHKKRAFEFILLATFAARFPCEESNGEVAQLVRAQDS
jgi:hypothetical protein